MSTYDPKDWRPPFNPWVVIIAFFGVMLHYALFNPMAWR